MTKELILKLLSALGVKIGANEGELKEEDAVKLVEDLFKAGNLGLVQKRDELLANEIKLKEKITAMETASSESNKKIGELDAQLKKNSPEENKKYYEGQLQEAKTKFEQEIAGITADRDKYRDSHFTRVRDDAVGEAIKDLKFRDGLKDGFISIVMMRNRFNPIEVDGKTAFTNQDNKTLQAVLHEFSLSKEGKAYLENGNQGGGAPGGDGKPGTGTGGVQMSRGDFMNLSDQAKMDFTGKGGVITDS
jgi:DNA polymerase III alpha subunit